MATVINNPTGSGEGSGSGSGPLTAVIIGIVVLVVAYLFIFYAIPMIQNGFKQGNGIEVNVKLPENTSQTQGQ